MSVMCLGEFPQVWILPIAPYKAIHCVPLSPVFPVNRWLDLEASDQCQDLLFWQEVASGRCSVLPPGGTEYLDACFSWCSAVIDNDCSDPLIRPGLGNDDVPHSRISWNAFIKKTFPSPNFCLPRYFCIERERQILNHSSPRLLSFFFFFASFLNTVSVSWQWILFFLISSELVHVNIFDMF